MTPELDDDERRRTGPADAPEHDSCASGACAENSRESPLTAGAPSLPMALPAAGGAFPPARSPSSALSLADIKAGDRLGEFELLEELGRGGFGCVFLARQSSLDRLVALKVTPDYGAEGRTLAQLEHENIVRVFSETRDPETGLRWLCMQYVAGPTLQRTMSQLQQLDPSQWSGQRLLQIIDGLNLEKVRFDPTALRDRELVSESDWVETVAWIGMRLAEALAYAFERGVLHRDIKPANVLFSQYGQPMLADFNLAFQATPGVDDAAASFGGTLSYMSPESLDAFNPNHPAGPNTTDHRSDLYSLGVVLYQLRHGRLPFRSVGLQTRPSPETLRAMADERRRGLPTESHRGCEHPLDRTITRCLAAEPDDRFGDAMSLARTLEGCRLLRDTERQLGPVDRPDVPGFLLTFAGLIALGLVPHLIGSGIQIAYNTARIVGQLTPAQHDAFMTMVFVYNPLVYSLCFGSLVGRLVAVYRGWRAANGRSEDEPDIDEARALAVALPRRVALVGCLGWFPGAVAFPLGMVWLAGPLPLPLWGHFLISFAMAGLIAVTYSFLGTQLLVLRWMYPRMWRELRDFRLRTDRELRPVRPRVHTFQMLAGIIPLLGAVLLLAVSPRAVSVAEFEVFRWLVAFLILMGIAGTQLANSADRQVGRVIAAFTGGDR